MTSPDVNDEICIQGKILEATRNMKKSYEILLKHKVHPLLGENKQCTCMYLEMRVG